jgi:hypothetical protein
MLRRLALRSGGHARLAATAILTVAAVAGCADDAPPGPPGRLLVTFPADAEPTGARTAVLANGAEVQADYGNHVFELPAGTYDVDISGKKVRNVVVSAGGETSMKVGVLRVTGESSRRVSVREGGREIAGAYGGELIGLPAGSFEVQVADRTETVTIVEGTVTDI